MELFIIVILNTTKMSKDYITLHKEQSERIDDFRNSLIISDFNNDEVVDYHKKWF